MVPPVLEKPGLRLPAVGQKHWVAVQHPLEVDPIIDLATNASDVWACSVVSTRRQDAPQQPSRVNRRHLALPYSFTGPRIHPMIKPTMDLGGSVGEKLYCAADALFDVLRARPLAFRGYA